MMVGEIHLAFMVEGRVFCGTMTHSSTSMFIIHILIIFKYTSSYSTLISNQANKESLSGGPSEATKMLNRLPLLPPILQ